MKEQKDTVDVIAIVADRHYDSKGGTDLSLTFRSISVPRYLATACDTLPMYLVQSVRNYDAGLILLDDVYIPLWRDDVISYYRYIGNPKYKCGDLRELCYTSSLVLDHKVAPNMTVATIVTPCCGCVTCRNVSMRNAYIVQYSYHRGDRNSIHSMCMDVYKVNKFMLSVLLSMYERREFISCLSYYIVDHIYLKMPKISSYEEMKTWLTKESDLFRMCAPDELRECTWPEMRSMIIAKAKAGA
jgi:hypothetical protein